MLKKVLSVVLSVQLLAAGMVMPVSSATAAETDRGKVAFDVKHMNKDVVWAADGDWTEGEYYEIPVQPGWISAAASDETLLATALQLDFRLGMSWDEDYLYTWISYTDPNGYAVSPGSVWDGACIQFSGANSDNNGPDMRLEYGIAKDFETNQKINLNWYDYKHSGFMDGTKGQDCYDVFLEGNDVTYEFRTPIPAFTNFTPLEGNRYAVCYVISWGNGGEEYAHTQISSGISGDAGKAAQNHAKITLVSENGAPEDGWYTYGDVQWKIDGTTLRIRGDGEIPAMDNGTRYPWISHCVDVTEVVFEEGITSLPYDVLCNYDLVESVSLPSTLQTMDSYCLRGLWNLKTLHIPASVTEIADDAINCNWSLQEITVDALRTMPVMFFPMSWTSPLTVAITTTGLDLLL